jgi:hypothetical protein
VFSSPHRDKRRLTAAGRYDCDLTEQEPDSPPCPRHLLGSLVRSYLDVVTFVSSLTTQNISTYGYLEVVQVGLASQRSKAKARAPVDLVSQPSQLLTLAIALLVAISADDTFSASSIVSRYPR